MIETTAVGLLDGANALEAVDRASIDIQIATAKRYPRKVHDALDEAVALATLDEETAGSMLYALKRRDGDGGEKIIQGPSARLAELLAFSWGNLRVDADIVAEDRTHVTAMGTAFDLERNIAFRVRVKRRITTSGGKRYGEDMIGVTSNAAISIALRNAIFKAIPAALANRVYHAARQAALGMGGDLTEKRQKALAWFGNLGVNEDQVLEWLGAWTLDDVSGEDLIRLRGLVSAIKDGETTVEEAFRRTDAGDAADLTSAIEEAEQVATRADAAEDAERPAKDPPAAKDPPKRKPKRATLNQVTGLEQLRDKARELDAIASDDEEAIAGALESRDADQVRDVSKRVSVKLAEAASAALGDE
jgi:hypothetical protein